MDFNDDDLNIIETTANEVNKTNDNTEQVVNEEIISNAKEEYDEEPTKKKAKKVKAKKAKKPKKGGRAKAAMVACLVLGMSVGSAFTLTTMRDGMVEEITGNLQQSQLSVPASSNTDTSIDSVNATTLPNSSSNVIARVIPSVVSVGILGPYSTNQLAAAGTGVVFQSDDDKTYIVTNNHVIDGASGVKIWFDGVEDSVDASLVGTEPTNDLAVISVSTEDVHNIGVDQIVPCTFGNSDDVLVGDSVIAIGNAMGEGISSTGGMISSKSKTITESSGAEFNVLQTDASINPGNSGGALVNANGEVIGINTAKVANSITSNVEGVGYAIPSNDVVDVINDIMNSVDRPLIGIKGFSVDETVAKFFSLPVDMGVFVKEVVEDGAAEKAGILPNDVITSFNGNPVTSMEGLQDLLDDCEAGDKVPVIIYRDGEMIETTVSLMQPESADF